MNKLPPGQVRIIAGSLRGSRLPVASLPGLRPTSDRARETLFNWLQQQVSGKRALDLFAGTGALGFEAASRGAAEVLLVERDPALAQSLLDSALRLKVESVAVECADALRWLARPADRRFDLVFVDPPFANDYGQLVAEALSPWLADQAWVYLESAVTSSFAPPAGWSLYREGRSREARHALYQVARPTAAGRAATLAGDPPEAATDDPPPPGSPRT